jgi:hypothetical protein
MCEGQVKKRRVAEVFSIWFKLSAAPQLPPPDVHFYLKRWKRV